MKTTKKRVRLTPFDPARYLTSEVAIAEYLAAILEANDPDLLVSALGDVARAKGMSDVARRSGLGRESLYKALAPGAQPRFETVMKVLHAVGLRFSVQARGEAVATMRSSNPKKISRTAAPAGPMKHGNFPAGWRARRHRTACVVRFVILLFLARTSTACIKTTDPEGYDQTCSADADCVSVASHCLCCGEPAGAINRRDLDRYRLDDAKNTCPPGPPCNADCAEHPAVCSGGTCAAR